MVEHKKVNLKLSSQQIKKVKEAVKSNNGTTLRKGNKNFNKEQLLHELLLTQTQINKLREKVENNMSTDIKSSKAQINKLIKSGGALVSKQASKQASKHARTHARTHARKQASKQASKHVFLTKTEYKTTNQ